MQLLLVLQTGNLVQAHYLGGLLPLFALHLADNRFLGLLALEEL